MRSTRGLGWAWRWNAPRINPFVLSVACRELTPRLRLVRFFYLADINLTNCYMDFFFTTAGGIIFFSSINVGSFSLPPLFAVFLIDSSAEQSSKARAGLSSALKPQSLMEPT